MGIPKFFRYISERYPLTSQLITPNSIPIFDNLYLDMNGIIHNCTHPSSSEGDATFRMTEQAMVLAIFAYIDHLFSKIKPRKVFFMAVDGVAPRAKMNQQRSRRFRTAKEAKELAEKAARKGEKMPDEKAFDSNCITPGTPFMARLSTHLQYFINKKIAEDAEWRGVQVILSGHDVPGEGEHKIQEFIRLSKAQLDYNPNTRHCLYGLDADLIMLGLLSHDPHFCLLREEVTFGRKAKKSGTLESANFYLLHLSLLREYLDMEFNSIAPELPFEYNLENVIDDFILLAVFVGNDFLPNLPNLHINEGAMENIWGLYKKVLPKAGGYMNESGTINKPRLQLLLDELADFEKDHFEETYADLNWYKGKQQKNIKALEMARNRGTLVLTPPQKDILNAIKKFVLENKATSTEKLTFSGKFSAKDRRVLQEIADDLHLVLAWDEYDAQGNPLVTVGFNLEETNDASAADGGDDSSSDGDDEAKEAAQRVLAKWAKAKVVEDGPEDFEVVYEQKLREQMDDWKRGYYKEKLEIAYDKPEEVHAIVYTYIEGLQWVMYYYYKGVASWGWFYNYHYAPKISDLKGVDKMEFNFVLGKPFKPFEQLMGVLPAASQEHIPLAFRDLMYDPNSPILDFYPEDFEADMNGKKAEWEAIVKIPFIDEKRLLKAMSDREFRLDAEEKSRNTNGLSISFSYDIEGGSLFPSSLPGVFPDLVHGHCRMEPFEMPDLEGLELVEGLLAGVHLGASALAGFPSTMTLPHTSQLGYHGVNVHMSESKNQSMVIAIENTYENKKTEEIADIMVGKRVFNRWPYLQEAMVVAVSDELFKYERVNIGKTPKIVANPQTSQQIGIWSKRVDQIEGYYSKRLGVITGHISVLLHVRPLKGLKRLDTGAFIKEYETADNEQEQALQLAVAEVVFEDERYLEQVAPPLKEDFPVGSRVFFLGDHAYGVAAQISDANDNTLSVSLAFFPNEQKENEFFSKAVTSAAGGLYYQSFVLSKRLHISGLALSKITSTLMVINNDGGKVNIGLSLKFEGKGLKVLGYTQKMEKGWEYSEAAAKLIDEYQARFPEVFACLDSRKSEMLESSEVFRSFKNPDARLSEVKQWLAEKGVRNFDPVSLFAEQLDKDVVGKIETMENQLQAKKNIDNIKKAVVKGIPRQAVLKPAHAVYRLQSQTFALGDRVVMVQDSAAGGVPLSAKGVVIGLNATSIDVVWDVPFMGGSTMGNRCSEYRGSSVPFSSCLNLTFKQFTASTSATLHPPTRPVPAVASVQHPYVGRPHSFFKPAPQSQAVPNPVSIMGRPKNQTGSSTNGGNYGAAAKGVLPCPPPTSQSQELRNTLMSGFARPPPRQNGGFNRPPSTGRPQTQVYETSPNHVRPPIPSAGRGGVAGRGGRGGGAMIPPPPQLIARPPPPGGARGKGRGRGGRGGAGQLHATPPVAAAPPVAAS